MKLPYRLKIGFICFIVCVILNIVLYNQKFNTTAGITYLVNAYAQLSFMRGWELDAFTLQLQGLITVFFSLGLFHIMTWRHKSKETPKEFADALSEIKELRKEIGVTQENLRNTDENIFTLFKYFNPVLKAEGLLFEKTEVGLIHLREAKNKIAQKNQIVKFHKDKIDELEDVEIDT